MGVEELRQQLKDAEDYAAKREGSIYQRMIAYDAVSDAQRALATALGLDYAVPFDAGCLPEAAVSGPVLLQTDYAAFLTFNAVKVESSGKRQKAGTAIVEIQRCTISQFGYPNDEALPGHPLYQRGLSAYGIYEVRNSRWIKQLTEQNRVSFPDTPDSKQTHFIICFHDSSFECISNSLNVTLSDQPIGEIFASIARRTIASD